MGVIVVFIDGIGLGEKAPGRNPLACFEPRVLRLFRRSPGPFPAAGRCLETRVDMGVEGLPQSATGHTALWTGRNAAQHIGRHLSGFPTPALRGLIQDHSLFRRLKEAGKNPTFANAYRPVFFEKRPRWVSASTVMCESAGVPLRTVEQVRRGRALYMDLSNRVLLEHGLVERTRTPQRAAQVLLSLAGDYDLVLYEYFLTDIVGHRGDMQSAVPLLEQLDLFLASLVQGLGKDGSLLVTSDHGNIEEIDHPRHTFNPVATLLWGPVSEAFPAEGLEITDITPALLRFLLQAPR
ncbi:MAG TPA: peptidase [Acidobacteriota bacterium]|nr:peptidase [Acidobacteriota bacterium]